MDRAESSCRVLRPPSGRGTPKRRVGSGEQIKIVKAGTGFDRKRSGLVVLCLRSGTHP